MAPRARCVDHGISIACLLLLVHYRPFVCQRTSAQKRVLVSTRAIACTVRWAKQIGRHVLQTTRSKGKLALLPNGVSTSRNSKRVPCCAQGTVAAAEAQWCTSSQAGPVVACVSVGRHGVCSRVIRNQADD
jgi:hypothetical protein